MRLNLRSLARLGGRFALCAALAILASRASAAVIITAPVINLPYSATARTGSFEVYVQNAEGTPPLIGADNVELNLPSTPGGVTFVAPPTPTTDTTPIVHPYLYPNQSPTEAVVNGGLTVEGSDFAPNSLPPLNDGAGLLLVTYQIPAGASGNFPLKFVSYSPPSQPLGTALFDANNVPLASTLQNGSINIAPAPEPATWLLAIVAVICGCVTSSSGRRAFRGTCSTH